jgi:hypothetical protein
MSGHSCYETSLLNTLIYIGLLFHKIFQRLCTSAYHVAEFQAKIRFNKHVRLQIKHCRIVISSHPSFPIFSGNNATYPANGLSGSKGGASI